ncbi:MAG: EamA family transporter [Proteobacteria bacterium]|nr:EamA family transporter [Pseudomonadota bacterium]
MSATSTNLPARIGWSPVVLGCLAATWFIWGSMYLAIKWALVSFPPFFQMGTEFVTAGALLALFARVRGAAWPSREQWFGGAILGLLLIGVGYGFTAAAEISVGSGLVVTFIAVVPALIALLEWPYGVRPTKGALAGIAIGFVGIVMLTQGQGFRAAPSGLAAISLSCFVWALGSVWAVHGLPGGAKLRLAPGLMGHASQMLLGGLILLAGSWVIKEAPTWPPQPIAVASWIYLVFASALIGYTAYMELLARTTPSLAASYTYVNPVVALGLGVLVDHEVITAREWVAAGLVLTGVMLLLLRQR